MKSMKKLLLLVVSLGVSVAAYAQDPNWVQAGISPDGTHYYLDTGKVSVSGKVTWFWAKRSDVPGAKYDSVVAHMYTDCISRDDVWSAGQTAYDKTGNVVATSRETHSMKVIDGSAMYNLVEGACKIAHEQAMQ